MDVGNPVKNITSAQKAWLIANTDAYRAELLTISLPNGQTLRAVIGAAADLLNYGGNSYYATANGVWARGDVTGEAMRGDLKANSCELTVAAADGVNFPGTSVPMPESFLAGVWDASRVAINVVYMPFGSWGAASVEVEMALFAGSVSDAQRTGRLRGRLTCQDDFYLCNLAVPKRLIQPGCANTFGDSACTFVLIGLTNTVGSGFTTVLIPPGSAWPSTDSRGNSILATYAGAGYFAGGKLKWTSGQNSGFYSSIVANDGSGNLTLAQAPPFPVAAGDAFTAYAGCQKTLTDCTARWGNATNFTGFPFVPPPESSV